MGKMFSFNPADYADVFAKRGYVHISSGLAEEFHKQLVSYVDAAGDQTMKDFAIGDKQQLLYEFAASDHYEELRQVVATICGVEATSLVLSERHIKAYEADANPYPLAHKDRFGSEIAVGFSINVPEGSTLVLYPEHDVSANPFKSTTELRCSFRADTAPEPGLKNARRVEIQDRPGDVMVFRGNAMWHSREHAANTTVMYLKLNTYNCDTLGEDPHSADVRQHTLEVLDSTEDRFLASTPVLGRKVDYVHRRYNRDWNEVVGVVLVGQSHLTISENEFQALQAMDGQRSLAELLQVMKECGKGDVQESIRCLAQQGVIDLLARPAELGQVARRFGTSVSACKLVADADVFESSYALQPQD